MVEQEKLPIKYRRNHLLKLRPVFRWVVKLRSSSRAIAGGLGIGAFIAFSPTYGLQIVLALFLATLLNCNRAATLVPVWITNPVTVVPAYTFNYWVGTFFWSGPPISEVSRQLMGIARELARLNFLEVTEQIGLFMHLGRDVIIPLVIGSMIVGIVAGLLVYWGSLRLLQWLGRHKRRKKLLS